MDYFKCFDAIIAGKWWHSVDTESCLYHTDEGKSYLLNLGYSEEFVEKIFNILQCHVWGRKVDEDLRKALGGDPSVIKAMAEFELKWLNIKNSAKEKNFKKQLKEVEEELAMYQEQLEDPSKDRSLIEYYIENEEHKIDMIQRELNEECLPGDIKVYRKGPIDNLILSWTTKHDGASMARSGASEEEMDEYRLTPDKESTVKTLIKQNIWPVEGFGVAHNFYGEGEVIFINLNVL